MLKQTAGVWSTGLRDRCAGPGDRTWPTTVRRNGSSLDAPLPDRENRCSDWD